MSCILFFLLRNKASQYLNWRILLSRLRCRVSQRTACPPSEPVVAQEGMNDMRLCLAACLAMILMGCAV